MTRTLPSLYSANYVPLVTQLGLDFKRWNSLPLSLIGRINVVKMNVLPRFLFLFQCTPLFLPLKFFKSLDETITSFLWGGKTLRVKKSTERFTSDGGLALQNVLLIGQRKYIN